jgi:hypothetical protein
MGPVTWRLHAPELLLPGSWSVVTTKSEAEA